MDADTLRASASIVLLVQMHTEIFCKDKTTEYVKERMPYGPWSRASVGNSGNKGSFWDSSCGMEQNSFGMSMFGRHLIDLLQHYKWENTPQGCNLKQAGNEKAVSSGDYRDTR